MATGGLGGRDQLAVADAFEKICHMDRYEFQDPVKITTRTEESRRYGGIAPPVFANACKRVLDEWTEHDEAAEQALIKGGPKEGMHKQLRETMCDNALFGVCRGLGKKVDVVAGTPSTPGERLRFADAEDEKCDDPNLKGKKKKKAAKPKDPITGLPAA